MDKWNDTPEMVGLLPAAIAEAEIAARHASLAAKDPSNLDAIKLHTAHVLHAVDPTQIDGGPGQGYGVKQGAEGAAKHIMAAANSDGASGAVKAHAEHVAASAQNTVSRADEIVMLAQKIEMADSAADASSLVAELNTLAQALLGGVDANGDGQVGWQTGRGRPRGGPDARQPDEAGRRAAVSGTSRGSHGRPRGRRAAGAGPFVCTPRAGLRWTTDRRLLPGRLRRGGPLQVRDEVPAQFADVAANLGDVGLDRRDGRIDPVFERFQIVLRGEAPEEHQRERQGCRRRSDPRRQIRPVHGLMVPPRTRLSDVTRPHHRRVVPAAFKPRASPDRKR